MKYPNGTPKTLKESIRNGLDDWISLPMDGKLTPCEDVVEKHVRDFLAQRFGVAMMQANGLEKSQFEKFLEDLFKRTTLKVAS